MISNDEQRETQHLIGTKTDKKTIFENIRIKEFLENQRVHQDSLLQIEKYYTAEK